MVTGRRIDAATGGHGVTWNDDRRRPPPSRRAAGTTRQSVFTVVARRRRVDRALRQQDQVLALEPVLARERSTATLIKWTTRVPGRRRSGATSATSTRAFRFLHLSLPDAAGHDRGFMSPAYLDAVAADRRAGRQGGDSGRRRPRASRGTTAVILTSDHGGQGADHRDARRARELPGAFMVRGPGSRAGADLYDDQPGLRQPGQPAHDVRRPPPVRNGDVANLALDLLELPAGPGQRAQRGRRTSTARSPPLPAPRLPASGHGLKRQPSSALRLLHHHRRRPTRPGNRVTATEPVAGLVVDHQVPVVAERRPARGSTRVRRASSAPG